MVEDRRKVSEKEQKKELIIKDPETVAVLFHEKKNLILSQLLHEEKTLIEIKNELGINPGTIKRHITDLLNHGLVYIAKKVKNEYAIVMKYYKATAKKYLVKIEWP